MFRVVLAEVHGTMGTSAHRRKSGRPRSWQNRITARLSSAGFLVETSDYAEPAIAPQDDDFHQALTIGDRRTADK